MNNYLHYYGKDEPAPTDPNESTDQDALIQMKRVIPIIFSWAPFADMEFTKMRKDALLKQHGSVDNLEYKKALQNMDNYVFQAQCTNYANLLQATQSITDFKTVYDRFLKNVMEENKAKIPSSYADFKKRLLDKKILTPELYEAQTKGMSSLLKWGLFGASAAGTMIIASQVSKSLEPQRRENWVMFVPLAAKIALGLVAAYGTYKAVDAGTKAAFSLFLKKNDVVDPDFIKTKQDFLEKEIAAGRFYSGDGTLNSILLGDFYPTNSMSMCSANGINSDTQTRYALVLATYITQDPSFMNQVPSIDFSTFNPDQISEAMNKVKDQFLASPNKLLRDWGVRFGNLSSRWCFADNQDFLEQINDSIVSDYPAFCKDVGDFDHLVQVFEGLFAGGDTPCRYAYDPKKWKMIKIGVYVPIALGGIYLLSPLIVPTIRLVGSSISAKADKNEDAALERLAKKKSEEKKNPYSSRRLRHRRY